MCIARISDADCLLKNGFECGDALGVDRRIPERSCVMRIPEDVLYVLSRLEEQGFEAYLVGGCVRDFLLGRMPQDFDITTNALPREIAHVFSADRVILTGVQHGTVTVLHGRVSVEVTTFRTDGKYGDGRHPDFVLFSNCLTEDLMRRDFTVNAMAMDRLGRITDPYGGQSDLQARCLRAVGDPMKRFSEDALRILRAFRFASVLAFEIESSTFEAAYVLASKLSLVSRERIFSELKKLLCGCSASGVLAKMLSGDLWTHIFSLPKINSCAFGYLDRLPFRADIRLSALLLGDPMADAHVYSLKPSAAFFHRVTAILHCPVLSGCSAPYLRRILADVGREVVLDRAQIDMYESGSGDSYHMVQKILSEENCFSIRDLKINGQDVLRTTALRGEQVGIALQAVLYAIFDGKIQNTRSDALEFLQIVSANLLDTGKKVDKC